MGSGPGPGPARPPPAAPPTARRCPGSSGLRGEEWQRVGPGAERRRPPVCDSAQPSVKLERVHLLTASWSRRFDTLHHRLLVTPPPPGGQCWRRGWVGSGLDLRPSGSRGLRGSQSCPPGHRGFDGLGLGSEPARGADRHPSSHCTTWTHSQTPHSTDSSTCRPEPSCRAQGVGSHAGLVSWRVVSGGPGDHPCGAPSHLGVSTCGDSGRVPPGSRGHPSPRCC